MARFDFNPVPEVAPTGPPGHDYEQIQASPGMFGAYTAQGTEKLGEGLVKTAEAGFDVLQFQQKVDADDQVNHWITRKDAIMRGEPGKTVQGPNGQPVPDLGYMGLQGRSAADARADTLKQLDDARQQGRTNLKSPSARLLYDEQTRRMYSVAEDTIGAHADQQWKTWAGGVNKTAAAHSLNDFVANLDNPLEREHHATDYISFKVQEAQSHFGDDAQIKDSVIAHAKADLLEAHVNAIGVKNPELALRFLDRHKDIAGVRYDNIYNALRGRAEKQAGDHLAAEGWQKTYQAVPPSDAVQPVLDQTGAKYGISGSYLTKTWQIESSSTFNPAPSSTGARGPFQFTQGTAKQYGLANPDDFNQSAAAAARLASDNKAALTPALHREPTDAELYLAHQQGAGGAAKLLLNPTVRAGDLVGDQAIRVNGGNPDAPASQFTSMWTAKFNGAGAAAIGSRFAATTQYIGAADVDENVRDHAMARAHRDRAIQMQALEETTQARRLKNEDAANEYTTKILTGQPVDMNAMATDPRLMADTKVHLSTLAESKGLVDDPQSYGPKYTETYGRIFAGGDDAGRITSMDQILKMGAPGGGLTVKGVDRLSKIYAESRNQKLGEYDPNAIHSTRLGLIKYAEQEMARTQLIPGMGPVSMNLKGERVYNSKFLPAFDAAFDAYMKKPHANPWDFLNKDNVDKIMNSVYPKSARDADSLEASGEAQKPAENEPMPAAPHGINAAAWSKFMTEPPVVKSGNRMPKAAWGAVLQKLHDEPTPENIKLFDESKFGQIGYRGEELLRQMNAPAPVVKAPLIPLFSGGH